MPIRPKTIRRLLTLAAGAALAGGSIAGAFYARQHAREARTRAERAGGMAACANGDYAGALPALRAYVASRPDDVGALYALATSCERLEAPDDGHLYEARTRFQQVLLRDPTNRAAKRRLLAIYDRLGPGADLLAMADDLLAGGPDAATRHDALRLRAAALARLDRHAEAADAWRAYLEADPGDFRAAGELLAAMRRAGAPADQIIARARAIAAARPDDVRLRLPLANALGDAGLVDESRALLAQLAAAPPDDPALVLELVATLDRARSFEEADRVLASAAGALGSADLNAALVRRAWQNGRHADAIALSARCLAGGRREPAIVGLRAMSLIAAGQTDAADALITELAARDAGPIAAAWADVLTLERAATPPAARRVVAVLRDAVARDGDNGIFLHRLGRALLAAGETDAGARALREAARRMPSWPVPCVDLSRALLAAGRLDESAAAAKAGYLRSPRSSATQLQVVRVRYAQLLGRADAVEEAALLRSVGELRAALPDEASLVPVHVSLLARSGDRAAAERLARDAHVGQGDAASLEELYRVARRSGLPVAEAVVEQTLARRQVTPALASLRAADLAATGGARAGIAFMSAQSAGHADDAAWMIADARTRSALGDAGAAAAWHRVLARFPDDLAVQAAAADERGLAGDRAALAAVDERLRVIDGENGSTWRLAHVRFLAGSSDPADARQALSLATDLVREQPGRADLRRVLARLLVRLDGTAAAIDHLRVAFDAAPGDAAVGLELVATLRRAARDADVPAVLARMGGFDYEPDALHAVATTLVSAGQLDVAARLLGRAEATGTLDAAMRLALAEVEAARGDDAAAARSYESLCAAADATPAALASAAAFERRAGHAGRVASLLARLDAARPTPDRDLALARFAAAFGEDAAARARYAAATASADATADAFCEAVAFAFARGALADASALLDRAQERFADDANVHRAALQLAALRAARSPQADAPVDAPLDALLAAMSNDPTAGAEAAALRALADARAAGHPTPELAARLMTLADQYPTALTLVGRAIDAALDMNDRNGAAGLAYRLLLNNPGRPDAIALAARTLARSGEYPAARRAALDWRRLADGPRAPDALLAAIALAEGDPHEALRLLGPHRADMRWPRDVAMFATLAEAYQRVGDAAAGFALLEPHVGDEAAARSVWLGASMRCDPPTALDRLATLEAATPVDAAVERRRLAGAYLDLAEASASVPPDATPDAAHDAAPEAARRGLALIEGAPSSSTPGEAMLRSELLRAAGRPADAVAVLRAALVAAPDDPGLKNGLAYLLLGRADGAAEARRLAAEATAAAPADAGYLDTLARASLAAGDAAAAERHFNEALRLDDECLDARIGLARLLGDAGRLAEAQTTMRQIDAWLARPAAPRVPRRLRDELQGCRARLATVRD